MLFGDFARIQAFFRSLFSPWEHSHQNFGVTRLRLAEVTVTDSIKLPDSTNRKAASWLDGNHVPQQSDLDSRRAPTSSPNQDLYRQVGIATGVE
jgi:hypothetical protein